MQVSIFKEELANSLTHGFGVLFGIVAVPILIALATAEGNVPGLIGAAIFGFSFLMVYGFSTLYHSVGYPPLKRALRILDHISIYFLIAGSYTPFILTYMLDATGITLLSVLWGMTLLGIAFKVLFTGRFDKVSLFIYLAMGWMLVVVGKRFFGTVPLEVGIMLVAGGLSYSLGVIFYRWKRLPFHHAIWHLFVLGGSVCHYVAVLLAVG
jgi:hemolysin III